MENVTTWSPEVWSSAALFSNDAATVYGFLVDGLTEFAVFGVSPGGRIMSWNAGAEHAFGYSAADIVGKHFSLIFTREDINAGAPANELTMALNGERTDHDRWHVRQDGTRFWGTNTVQPIYDRAGTLFGFAKVVRDTTDTYLAREALNDSEQRLRLLLESVHEYAIFALALDGTITSWNVGAQMTFGYAEHEIIGCPLSVLFTADDLNAGVPALELREATRCGSSTSERWLVRKDRTRFLSSNKLSQLKRGPDGELRGFVQIAHDITERKNLADEMRRRASNDELTKLPNRTTFYEHVYRAIASMKRRPANLFAVLFIDLDYFKAVNDTYGHIIADKVLEYTARSLEQCVRSGDVVARLSGDEFAVLLSGISGVGDAHDASDRIGVEMALPIAVDGYEVHVTASVGIALGDLGYDTPEDILADADAAMYVAKTHGRAQSVLFDPEMKTYGRQKLDLEADLRDAIEHNELRVEYQPLVELKGRSIVGFEALVRWQHPRRGLLQPGDFLPGAEQTDAIIPLDRWVLRSACDQLFQWQRQRIATSALQMSVNFSSKQFSQLDLVDDLRKIFEASGVDPHSVRIEITESGVIERCARTTAMLEEIRQMGVELHIDDFGMGFSSLASLTHMPFDALKIDRSFIEGMVTFGGSELVRSIAVLAHNLGLVSIAEGVETVEQLNRLIGFDCNVGQGLLFSKPLDSAAAGDFLTAAGHGVRPLELAIANNRSN